MCYLRRAGIGKGPPEQPGGKGKDERGKAVARMSGISRRHMLAGLLAGGVAATLTPVARAGKVTNFNRRNSGPPTRTTVFGEEGAPPMLSPESPRLLEEAVVRYDLAVRAGGWPRLPEIRRILVAGSRGATVKTLRERLFLEGYLPPEARKGRRYDSAVAAAVMRFQRAHGLRVSGHVDRATWHELNVPAEQRLAMLQANLPRVEWAAGGIAPRFILVNIPATQVEAVEKGRVYSRHNVIVGMPDRPSPAIISKVSELNFNPYWTAPRSIVVKDIIPQARKEGPLKFLKRMRIRIYDGFKGPEVDPATLDWNNIDVKRFVFRQDPGEENAMATVKINFPNRHAVYMHDTPTKQLFTESERYFSSGCVRVEQVHVLTEWILKFTPGWDRRRIEEVVRSGERIDVHVEDPPNVIWAYLTAWVTPDGQVHFREDIYRLDGTGFVHGQPQPVRDYAAHQARPR